MIPQKIPRGLNDSKKLDADEREKLYEKICATAQVAVAFGAVERIDRDNILRASLWALARAVKALPVRPKLVFVDGNQKIDCGCDCEAVVSGDALVLSVAAASIVAKVTRDRLMVRLGLAHPGYGFERHMGYSVPEHFAALVRLGPTIHHRKSFAPVAARLAALGVALRRGHLRLVASLAGLLYSCPVSQPFSPRRGQCITFPCSLNSCAVARGWCSGPSRLRKPRCGHSFRRCSTARRPAKCRCCSPSATNLYSAAISDRRWLFGSVNWPSASRAYSAFTLLAQACVVGTYWAVFTLGQAIVGIRHAVLGVLLMVGIAAFTVPSPDFGPAVLAAPLWALALLCYWRAVGERRRGYWFLLALDLGLLMLASYTGLILLALVIVFTPSTARGVPRSGTLSHGSRCCSYALSSFRTCSGSAAIALW